MAKQKRAPAKTAPTKKTPEAKVPAKRPKQPKPPRLGADGRRVAVVAGATRGAGRGIARALGEAGFLVVCTGRSTSTSRSSYAMPETIDETAAIVNAAAMAAGHAPCAIAIRVDHSVEKEVAKLFARVERELGLVEVVVDSVAGEDPALGGWDGVVDGKLGDLGAALTNALGSRLITAQHGARALKKFARDRVKRSTASATKVPMDTVPLLVEVVEYDLPLGAGGNLLAAVVKSSLKILAATLAEALRPDGVAAVSITPGFLRSEAMLRHFQVTTETWRDGGAQDRHFLQSESPMFIGRVIAALAADPDAMAKTAMIWSSWELARAYGVADEDGSRPDWGSHWRTDVVPSMADLRGGIERQAAWLEALAKRAREQLAGS
jgi:NAD(P)-dependent dehydrogenase (short-subunit alcohol dehydrogenase family)